MKGMTLDSGVVAPLLSRFRAKLGVCMTLVAVALMGGAFAQEGGSSVTVDTIRALTTTQLTTVQQAMLQLIQDILPVALVVMGSILVVSLGVRLFRRFAG